MNRNTNSLLGRTADITIDRQSGSRNIRHKNITYSIRQGYFAAEKNNISRRHTIYIIGAENTSNTFEGTIISTIRRKDTNEILLVAAPTGKIYYEPQIRECLGFYEKGYNSEFEFYMQKKCGIILFTCDNGKPEYYLMENKKTGHVGFPDGYMVFGEKEEETAVREVLEKTGIFVQISEKFRSEYVFAPSENTREKAVYFLASYNGVIPVISDMESYSGISLKFEDAVKKLDYPQDIILLMEARDYYDTKRKGIKNLQ